MGFVKTIKVGNVRKNQFGYVIGVKKDDGEWVNLYLNDQSLAPLFSKGAEVQVEIERTKSGNLVIKGASPVRQAQTAARDPETAASIERQTAMKAWAEVQHGNHSLTPEEFARQVLLVWSGVFRGEALVQEAIEALDATPEAPQGEFDDGIPF